MMYMVRRDGEDEVFGDVGFLREEFDFWLGEG